MKPHWIDSLLPPMKCDTGCGECCGFAPCDKAELQRIADYAEKHSIVPLRQGHRCPWFQGGTCAVHPVRPATCRLFGHVERLTCPRGYNVNVSTGLERYIMRRVKVEQKRLGDMAMTHDAAYSPGEVQELLYRHVGGVTPLTISAAAGHSG